MKEAGVKISFDLLDGDFYRFAIGDTVTRKDGKPLIILEGNPVYQGMITGKRRNPETGVRERGVTILGIHEDHDQVVWIPQSNLKYVVDNEWD